MLAALVRLVAWSRAQAALVVVAALLLAGAGAWYTATHLGIDTDLDKLISPDLPWRQRDAAMDRAFPQNNNVLAVVIDAATPDLAQDAAASLAARLAAEPQLYSDVRVPEGGPFFAREGLLFLSTAEVQNFADQIIAAQPMIGTLAADPSLRGVFDTVDLLAQGAIRGDIAAKELDAPLAKLGAAIEAALAGRYAPLSWQSLLSGRTPDPHELRRFVLAQPALDYRDIEPGARAIQGIAAAARALGLTPERGVTVRVTGPVALSDDQLATLREGAGFSTALSLGLLLLWLLLGLRSPRLVAAIMVTLIVGLIGCASFATVAVGALNPISAAFAVLFVGLAVDFGIQFGVRYRDERHRTGDLGRALDGAAAGVGGPLAAAAAATAVGFLAFVPTDYTGVSDLGLIAGVGMLLALALNLTLLPALIALLKPSGEKRAVGYAWAAPIDALLLRRRGAVIAVACVLAAGALAALPRLSFDFNPLDLQRQDSEAMQALAELKKDPLETPYSAVSLEPSIEAARALAKRLDALPEVAQTVTAASFVPDDQPAKLDILSDAAALLGPSLTPPMPKPAPSAPEIAAALDKCARDMAEAAGHAIPAAAQFASLLREAARRGASLLPALQANLVDGLPRRLDGLRQSLSAAPVSLTTLPAEVRRDWITLDGRARVEIFPKGGAPDNAALRRFVRAVLEVAPEATGTPVTIQASADTVLRAFIVAGMIALAAIALLLMAVLRSARDMAMVLLPLALAGLLTLATGALADFPLNFANIITLPLLLGIGVAFDIYFVMRWRTGAANLLQSSTARAVLFSALTTGTAFGSLALSNNPGTAEMGKLLSIALFYTLASTLLLLPALLGKPPR